MNIIQTVKVFIVFVFIATFPTHALANSSGIYIAAKFMGTIQGSGEVSTHGGGSYLGGFFHSGFALGGGLALGYDFYPAHSIPIRLEAEYALRGNEHKDWQNSGTSNRVMYKLDQEALWNTSTLFMNVYWDFHNSTAFTPYIGGGLGMASIYAAYNGNLTVNGVNAMHLSYSDIATTFAWNAAIGCAYAITDNFSLDLSYRFVGMSPASFSTTRYQGSMKFAPYNNEFLLGLRLTF